LHKRPVARSTGRPAWANPVLHLARRRVLADYSAVPWVWCYFRCAGASFSPYPIPVASPTELLASIPSHYLAFVVLARQLRRDLRLLCQPTGGTVLFE